MIVGSESYCMRQRCKKCAHEIQDVGWTRYVRVKPTSQISQTAISMISPLNSSEIIWLDDLVQLKLFISLYFFQFNNEDGVIWQKVMNPTVGTETDWAPAIWPTPWRRTFDMSTTTILDSWEVWIFGSSILVVYPYNLITYIYIHMNLVGVCFDHNFVTFHQLWTQLSRRSRRIHFCSKTPFRCSLKSQSACHDWMVHLPGEEQGP